MTKPRTFAFFISEQPGAGRTPIALPNGGVAYVSATEHPGMTDGEAMDAAVPLTDQSLMNTHELAIGQRAVGIIELLARIGEEKVQIQALDGCFRGAQSLKDGATEIRFGTMAITATELMLNSHRVIGMILWLPRIEAQAIIAAARERK